MTDQLSRLTAALAGRYAIEGELGAGGMATVYLARDVKHQRNVAVKVLRPEFASALGSERFVREIGIAAQLHHPHILPLFDSGEADGFLYYVMPYEEGQSLRDKLAAEGELPIAEAVSLLCDIVGALAHAHRHGVVHRDIKPENVMLSDRHAILTDFGVAKAVSQACAGAKLTSVGVALGTPTYMAPEQAAGDPDVDHRADIYAVGALAYELLTGAPPFDGASAQEIMAAHLTKPPEPLSSRRETIPTALEFVVLTCLQKHPADRWQTAAELLYRLESSVTPSTPVSVPAVEVRRVVDQTFKLTAEVCRKLDRETLDPRIIGDRQHYLDNKVASDVMVVFHHGMGLDQREFEATLLEIPFRGIAPTLYGFEPNARRRHRLRLHDQVTLQREMLAELIRTEDPNVVILVGFSSGADLAFQMLETPLDAPHQVDGLLSLDCNLSLNTCFVSRRIASISEHGDALLRDFAEFGSTVSSVGEWVNLHDYLVKVFRKFPGDLEGLKAFAADVVGPFESGDPLFVSWYRSASAALRTLRCVFSDTEMYNQGLDQLKLEHIDSGILGEHYDEASLVTELDADHFDLLDSDRLARHLEAVVTAVRE